MTPPSYSQVEREVIISLLSGKQQPVAMTAAEITRAFPDPSRPLIQCRGVACLTMVSEFMQLQIAFIDTSAKTVLFTRDVATAMAYRVQETWNFFQKDGCQVSVTFPTAVEADIFGRIVLSVCPLALLSAVNRSNCSSTSSQPAASSDKQAPKQSSNGKTPRRSWFGRKKHSRKKEEISGPVSVLRLSHIGPESVGQR